jgi:hypothetical protein
MLVITTTLLNTNRQALIAYDTDERHGLCRGLRLRGNFICRRWTVLVDPTVALDELAKRVAAP